MASSTTATYYSSPPMTMDYSFAAPTTAPATATPSYPSSYSSPEPPALHTTTTALVPATAPGATIYNNYTLPGNTGDEDLLDLGGASTSSSSYYKSPPPPSADDLLSFDNDYSTAAASNRDRTRNNTVDEDAVNLQALQERDDTFVNNLPRELIEEQQRILAQIQKGNTSSSSSTTNDRQLVAFNTIGHERYQQRFAAMPNSNGNSELSLSTTTNGNLPAEVHPRKYQMKTERKVKTATAATAGAIIGGLILAPVWPLGAMAGAAAGGYAGKVAARSGERKQQRKWEHKQFNDYTNAGQCDVQSTTVAFA